MEDTACHGLLQLMTALRTVCEYPAGQRHHRKCQVLGSRPWTAGVSARALQVLSVTDVVASELVKLESFLRHLCRAESAFLWARQQ